MKILVTGSAGFVGKNLCKLLRSNGVDYNEYDLENGDDIRDKFKLEKLFETGNYNIVVHLAALTGARRGEKFPDEYITTNITGTFNIINCCQRYGCNLIFFSSSGVLGGNSGGGGLVESDNYHPKNLYTISKVAGEMMVKNSGLNYAIIRPFNIYGPEGRRDMVLYKWIDQVKAGKPVTVYGTGHSARGYTYVYDLVKAIYVLCDKINNPNNQLPKIFHLGGSEIIYLGDLLQTFVDYCNKKKLTVEIKYENTDVEEIQLSYADTSLAMYNLDFVPSNNFIKNILKILKKEL